MEQAHQVPAHVSLRGCVPHRPSPGISLPFHLVSDSSCLALGTSLHLGVCCAGWSRDAVAVRDQPQPRPFCATQFCTELLLAEPH